MSNPIFIYLSCWKHFLLYKKKTVIVMFNLRNFKNKYKPYNSVHYKKRNLSLVYGEENPLKFFPNLETGMYHIPFCSLWSDSSVQISIPLSWDKMFIVFGSFKAVGLWFLGQNTI